MRKTIIVLGIAFAILFAAAGILDVIPWTIAGILAPVSLGVAGLLLKYPSKTGEKPTPAEATTVREKHPEEPEVVIDEAPVIREDEHVVYVVQLDEGDTLKVEVSADGPVGVFLVTKHGLTNFENEEKFLSEAGAEGVTRTTIDFMAPRNGKWFLVVDNPGEGPVTANISLYVE